MYKDNLAYDKASGVRGETLTFGELDSYTEKDKIVSFS